MSTLTEQPRITTPSTRTAYSLRRSCLRARVRRRHGRRTGLCRTICASTTTRRNQAQSSSQVRRTRRSISMRLLPFRERSRRCSPCRCSRTTTRPPAPGQSPSASVTDRRHTSDRQKQRERQRNTFCSLSTRTPSQVQLGQLLTFPRYNLGLKKSVRCG